MLKHLNGLFAGLFCVTAALAEPALPTLRGDLDDAIDKAIVDQRLVGAVVLVMHDGKFVYRRAAGYADRESKTKMQEDTIFRLSSVSKPIVVAAAMALVDQGKLRLDQPVTDWLPDFRPALPNGETPAITIRQLLNHTAGLSYGFLENPNGPYHQFGVSDGMDESRVSLEEETRRVSAAGLAYEPGKGWGYSVAIDVLGNVISSAAGKPLPDVVHDLVTKPLRMTDTGFSIRSKARLATPYVDGNPAPGVMKDPQVVPFAEFAGIRFSPSRTLGKDFFPSGGAGMVGTAGDVARFLDNVRQGGQPVLRQATARSMMANQTADFPINLYGPGWGFGFGGAVLRDPALAKTPQSAGTWAWGGVYGHSWFVDPARKLTVVVMTNTAFEGMAGKLPTDVRNAVYKNIRE
ncbi:serine hydrolase domain-containing protein [Bradyrhizobium sp. 2TAF24]|uniref:serine hydrolase domain-containing protein n=1 Tax=Bradyrhizobium sp. 2TAF24 TaxID=3233011 RepID=UPI003F933B83